MAVTADNLSVLTWNGRLGRMIITLCGSARFESEFHYWNERLTLDGHCVFSLAVFPSSKGGNKNWYDAETKIRLDKAHLAKIDCSNAAFVIDCAGPLGEIYIGESTSREIEHAKKRGKLVIYSSAYRLANG